MSAAASALCGLVLPGLSETIRVTSVIDRFLEHSRIYYFENAGDPEVLIGSADLMDRNLSRRVEVVFPIEQADLKARLIDEILTTSVKDNAKSRLLLADGSYQRVMPGKDEPLLRSQSRFLELAIESEHRLQLATAGSASPPPPSTPEKPKVVPRRKAAK